MFMKNPITFLYHVLATFCGVGFLPKAPGTWGSLAGVGIYVLWEYFLYFYFNEISFFYTISLHCVLIALLFGLGWWSSFHILRTAKDFTQNSPSSIPKKAHRDPSFIVIDEVVGMMLTLVMLKSVISYNTIPVHIYSIFLGFFLFRVFDIFKPFPIGKIDQRLSQKSDLMASFGIMIDDVLAAIMAGFVGIVTLTIFFNS